MSGSISGAQLALASLNLKLRTGSKLTSAEKLLASTAAATQQAHGYGPGPGETQAPEIPLAVSVKGAIASAMA